MVCNAAPGTLEICEVRADSDHIDGKLISLLSYRGKFMSIEASNALFRLEKQGFGRAET